MKKIIPILFIFFIIYGLTNQEEILIPDYAIRLRIIANSNQASDQELKFKVKSNLENYLNELMLKAYNEKEAKTIITENISNIKDKVNQITPNNEINFGQNYFPLKTYHGVKYQAGMYESLVITLGKGQGNNWWCVMFPPLCLLEGKKNNTENIEYKFLIKEILAKYQT